MSVVEGIDVSGWQHPGGAPIDWVAVAKAGKRFAIVKATQGTTGLNPWLHKDAVAAHEAGLSVGVYHYAVPGPDDGPLQAEWFMSACQGLVIDFGYWLDLETDGSLQFYEVDTWAQAFLETIKAKGHLCGPYLNDDYLTRLPGSPWGYPLWLSFSTIPAGVKPAIHQGEPITCAGIVGQVDPDVFLAYRGVEPPGNPAPSPGPLPKKDEDMGTLVSVAGSNEVDLVGGVPVVRQHIGPEQEKLLLALGYPKVVDVNPAELDSIPIDNGPPATAEAAVDPLGTTATAGTTDTIEALPTAVETPTEAVSEVPTAGAEAGTTEAPGSTSPGPVGGEAPPVAPVINPGWQ